MAKRFTDSTKWNDPFLRSLKSAYKILWLYIHDECDHAGIWQVDFDVAKVKTGEKFDKSEAEKHFFGRIVPTSDGKKWFLPEFIDFQYGELSEKNKVHASVLASLKKNGILNHEFKPLASPLHGAMDKDKDKDKEKDKEKENQKFENSNLFISTVNERLNRSFKLSPKIITAWDQRLKEGYTIENLCTAIENAKADSFHKENGFKYLTAEFFSRQDKLDKWLNTKPMDKKENKPTVTDQYGNSANYSGMTAN